MHPRSGPRRRHSDELKAKVLAACDAPGASISGVALAHGLNTNLVRKWRSGRGAKFAGTANTPAAASQAPSAPLGTTPEFVAIEMRAPSKAAVRAATEVMAAAKIAGERLAVPRNLKPTRRRTPSAAASDQAAGLCQRCGSSSSMRLFGWLGSRSSTSRR